MYCPNCGSKLEDDANFCTNCGYKVGAPLTGENSQGASQGSAPADAAPGAQAGVQNTQYSAPNAGAQTGAQYTAPNAGTANSAPDAQTNAQAPKAPKLDLSQPLIDNEKLPEGIRNMPAHKFNALAIWSAVVGLVMGIISMVFLIPVDTDFADNIPLIMGTQGGSMAIYIVFLILFIAGLIMTIGTEVLGGIHFARKADYKGLPVVLIANFVEFIMMFFMIPTMNFFSKVSNLLIHIDDIDSLGEVLDFGVNSYHSVSNAPSIAAGIVMIVISIAVIVVIAKFTAPEPTKESAEPVDF